METQRTPESESPDQTGQSEDSDPTSSSADQAKEREREMEDSGEENAA